MLLKTQNGSPNIICDVIKQNESEVGQIQFSFFWLIVYIIGKATFYSRRHWNWSIGSNNRAVEGLQKQWEIKKFPALSIPWNQYLWVLTHFGTLWSYFGCLTLKITGFYRRHCEG